jgi:transcriptional regulator with XRE-family HTH domain
MDGHWGPRLRRERERHGYSFEDLADELNRIDPNLNMDRTTAWRWERTGSNGRRPRPRYVRALCRLYHTSPAALGLVAPGDSVGATVEARPTPAYEGSDDTDRREFLGVLALGGLAAAAGVQSAAFRPSAAKPHRFPTAEHPSHGTVADLEALAQQYRRAYSETPVHELLPRAQGLIQLAGDLQAAGRHSPLGRRLTSIVGQAALLAGLLSLMGKHDLRAASSYYETALVAAVEANNHDLAAYAMGSLSFHDAYAGDVPAALRRIEQTDSILTPTVTSTTRAWLAALRSELYARNGDERRCRYHMEQADLALQQRQPSEPHWMGVGEFDAAKLAAYEGGNLVILGRPRDAEQALTRSLTTLDGSRLKHRATAHADLAAALVHPQRGELEEACRHGSWALAIATQIEHAESVQRVCRVYRQMKPWYKHAAVRSLGEELVLLV